MKKVVEIKIGTRAPLDLRFGYMRRAMSINHAVLHGNRGIKAIAIVMDANRRDKLRPCRACLQYIHDFAVNSKAKVIMTKADRGKTSNVKTVEKLFPFPYKK